LDKVSEKLKLAESMIEKAIWDVVRNEDIEAELKTYREVEKILNNLCDLPEAIEQERKRVLAYCLMRIDESLNNLGESEGTLERAEESLLLAIESGDSVQIARSKLAKGIRLLNDGKLPEAEVQFTDIIKGGIENENRDMQQVVGWTLFVRANILKGKSLYDQALSVAQDAVGILSSIDNYAGLRQVYSIISMIYLDLGNKDESGKAKDMSTYFEKKAKEEQQ
jgi:tetratricopeptide (TPR) repeat protein